MPAGFVLAAFGAIGLVVASAGLHAWMAGAAGMMTLAVMTRASLGHTGQELTASVRTELIYASIFVAAVARIYGALEPRWSDPMLHAAAFAWVVAFLGFGIVCGPALCRPRKT